MCGSKDLIKQDGVFVCQSCGCKYSVEEAKKMIVEGTVDVTGSTVKVDTSAELANLYQIARRAKDDNNSENAAKYYDMILVKDPTSWEAAFYAVYFKAMSCTIAQIRSAAKSVSNCEKSVLELIRDNVPKDEQAAAVKEVLEQSQLITELLKDGASNAYREKRNYNEILATQQNDKNEYLANMNAIVDILYTCGSQIDRIFGDKKAIAPFAADAWKAGIKIHQYVSLGSPKEKNIIASYKQKITKYYPDYLYDEKRRELEDEIASYERLISDEPSKPVTYRLGIFFMICGVLMALLNVGLTILWIYLVAAIEIALGILIVILSKKSYKKNVARWKTWLKQAQEELDATQKELDALKKQK